MPTLWFTRIKLNMSKLTEVPERYYDEVLAKLVAAGLYNEDGTKVEVEA